MRAPQLGLFSWTSYPMLALLLATMGVFSPSPHQCGVSLAFVAWRPVEHSHYPTRSLAACAKKRNRSSKSKVNSPAPSSGDSIESEQALPPSRVDTNIGVSVKKQLRLVDQLRSKDDSPNIGGRYRRSKDNAMESFKGRKSGDGDPTRAIWMPSAGEDWSILVDGYNVIGASDDWSRLRDAGKLDEARDLLIEGVSQVASMRNWRTEVVFDSYQTDTPESRCEKSKHVTIVYTCKQESADGYIERIALSNSEEGTMTMVVTNDNFIKDSVQIHGGYCMSSEQFMQELDRTNKEALFLAKKRAAPSKVSKTKKAQTRMTANNQRAFTNTLGDAFPPGFLEAMKKKSQQKQQQQQQQKSGDAAE